MTLGDFTTIYIDNHEPDEMEDHFLRLDYGTEWKDLVPHAADYMQENVIIERKKVDDFVNSVIGSRTSVHSIYDQLNRMVASDKHAYLVIEGTVRELRAHLANRKVNMKTFYGAMGGLAVNYNMPPMWAHNKKYFAYVVGKIFKSHREGKFGLGRDNKVSYVPRDANAATRILSVVPGMDKLAFVVAEQLGLETIDDVNDITVDDLVAVDLIGQKRAQTIYNDLRNIPQE